MNKDRRCKDTNHDIIRVHKGQLECWFDPDHRHWVKIKALTRAPYYVVEDER